MGDRDAKTPVSAKGCKPAVCRVPTTAPEPWREVGGTAIQPYERSMLIGMRLVWVMMNITFDNFLSGARFLSWG